MHFFGHPVNQLSQMNSSEKDRVKNISWFTMFFVIGFMAGPLLGTAFLENLGHYVQNFIPNYSIYPGYSNNYFTSSLKKEHRKSS